MRILVADDDQAIRELLTEVLEDDGHAVAGVSTPEAAIALSRGRDWDLFVIDTLGQADHGLTEECKGLATELAARAPVILCTGRPWAERVQPSDVGVAAIISKPFDIAALSEMVARIGGQS